MKNATAVFNPRNDTFIATIRTYKGEPLRPWNLLNYYQVAGKFDDFDKIISAEGLNPDEVEWKR